MPARADGVPTREAHLAITQHWMVDFRNVPNGDTVSLPFFLVGGFFGAPRRFFLLGGTMSSASADPANGHLRFEVLRMDPGDPVGVVVWDRDIVRMLDGGEVGLELDLLSDAVNGLLPGPYVARLQCMGASKLGPNDAFFVVAIDMDDGANPFMSNPGLSAGTVPNPGRKRGRIRPQKTGGAGQPKPKGAKRKTR